ncbi:MAG: glycogen synthase GlgA [Verrucomicrobiota bacterium]
MNILYTASELAPYVKTGGLGDVLAALPREMHKRGHEVSVAVPLYRVLKEKFEGLRKTELRLQVPLGGQMIPTCVWEGKTPEGVTVFAIQRDEFYDRAGLYGNEDGDYLDNPARFSFLSRAVVELAKHIEPQVDIIHANDWHTALIPAYVRAWGMPFNTVLTIHNLAYQGQFPGGMFADLDLPTEYFSPAGVEFYGRINFLKGGITLAHAVTTVSPTHAKEIQSEMYGFGLHQVLAGMRYKLTGILNGMDEHIWHPKKDPFIAKHYDAEHLAGKMECKKDLLKAVGFKGGESKPLFGIVARLVAQKGFDLVLEMMEKFLQRDARLVVLGMGDPALENEFRRWAKKKPSNIRVKIQFDEKLAHKIEAGCDFFLMPSLFEPCGLNQFYSLKYGTIPIVRDTGGLSDSVQNWDGVTGTGFKFSGYEAKYLLEKVDEALKVFGDEKAWNKLRQNAMKQDFSWKTRVLDYEKFYQNLPSV